MTYVDVRDGIIIRKIKIGDGTCNVCGQPCRLTLRICAECKHWYELYRAWANFARLVRQKIRLIAKRSMYFNHYGG